ncbi:hypothetical protein [Candidatus Magnetominusculus dajiuhuensis]|uniref:hypothetical protein n=1 Tax=Candidatus Magnetominusculus dajiuhuensis TaxID=3137712 RepID=UPI003B42CBFC
MNVIAVSSPQQWEPEGYDRAHVFDSGEYPIDGVLIKNRRMSVYEIINCCVLLCLLIIIFPSRLCAEWADWIADVSLSTEYRNNINYMFAYDEKRGDFVTSPAISLGRYYQLGEYTRLRLTADISSEVFGLYHRLDSILAGPSFVLVQKLGIGHEIPWISLKGSASYLTVSDSNRDSVIYTAGINAGGYVSERIDLQAGYLFTARRGKGLKAAEDGASGRVFDLNSHRISLIANFLIAPSLVITPGYSFNTGDFVSSACRDYVSEIKEYSKANTLDNDYGEPMWTYKMHGHSHQLTFGASYALTGHLSLNAGYSYVLGQANGWKYYENIEKFAVMYSY